MYEKHLSEILAHSYYILRNKLVHGSIKVDNESSFQLQFAYILNSIGRLYEFKEEDRFSIELENQLLLNRMSAKITKQKTKYVNVDIMMSLGTPSNKKTCAIELKYFQKNNQREPNNRYDVFAELYNLESYKDVNIDLCYLIVATDHEHYVMKDKYSEKTRDFDFRHNATYLKDTKLVYRTEKPYGEPISLKNNYAFKWDMYEGLYFLKVEVV